MACMRKLYHILLRAATVKEEFFMKITLDLPGGGRLELERKPMRKERSSFLENMDFLEVVFGTMAILFVLGMVAVMLLTVIFNM